MEVIYTCRPLGYFLTVHLLCSSCRGVLAHHIITMMTPKVTMLIGCMYYLVFHSKHEPFHHSLRTNRNLQQFAGDYNLKRSLLNAKFLISIRVQKLSTWLLSHIEELKLQ